MTEKFIVLASVSPIIAIIAENGLGFIGICAMNLGTLMVTIIEAMLIVAGAGEIEELTEDEIQRFEYFASHPLTINSASACELENSGLFTTFRAASLSDYISRNGPVLSVRELAAVDGFDSSIAQALSHFVSFAETAVEVGNWSMDSEFQTSVTSRGLDASGQTSLSWLSCAKVRNGQRLYFNVGAGGLWEQTPKPGNISLSSFTLSCGAHLPKSNIKLYLGDFNARFGQGVILWNTLLIDSATSVNSLVLRPSGLAVSHSSKGNYANTGAGISWAGRSFSISAALGLPGLKSSLIAISAGRKPPGAGFEPMLNINWWGRHCTLGLSSVTSLTAGPSGQLVTSSISTDFRSCLRGADLAGELALTFATSSSATSPPPASISARLACALPVGEFFKAGALLGYSPDKHLVRIVAQADAPKGHHFSVGTSFTKRKNDCTARIDCTALFKWADIVRWEIRLKDDFTFLQPQNQVHSGRTMLSAVWAEHWTTSLMAACSKASEWGLAIFLEQAYRSESFLSAHLRAGIFSIDDWDGRIYFYEYDIPGRFTVPALYGRGYWISAHLNALITRYFRLAFRLAYKDYGLMEPGTRKASVLEARLSFTSNF